MECLKQNHGFKKKRKRETVGDIWEKYAQKHSQTVALRVCILTVQSQGLVSTKEKEKAQ